MKTQLTAEHEDLNKKNISIFHSRDEETVNIRFGDKEDLISVELDLQSLQDLINDLQEVKNLMVRWSE